MKNIIIVLLTGVLFQLNAQRSEIKTAELYLKSGDLSKAKEHFDTAMKYEDAKTWTRSYSSLGDYYFKSYEQSQSLSDLTQAVDNYKKSLELDVDGKNRKFIEKNLDKIRTDLINIAINKFNAKEFKDAMIGFDYATQVRTFPKYAKLPLDTSIVYNAGLAAYNAELYKEATEYLKKAATLGYERKNGLILAKQAQLALADTAGAAETLKESFNYFPEESGFIVELIKLYMLSNQNQQAMEYIQLGKQKSPNNEIIYYAEGILYEQNKESDKAIEAYKKALEVKPDYFSAAYNVGVIYYNSAAALIEEANKLPMSKAAEYDALIKQSEEKFQQALPYLEKAREIKGDDKNTLISLKEIYYRLKMTDKFNEVKALLQ